MLRSTGSCISTLFNEVHMMIRSDQGCMMVVHPFPSGDTFAELQLFLFLKDLARSMTGDSFVE